MSHLYRKFSITNFTLECTMNWRTASPAFSRKGQTCSDKSLHLESITSCGTQACSFTIGMQGKVKAVKEKFLRTLLCKWKNDVI